MTIGILGAGNVGAALGKAWQRHGHEVLYGSREPGTIERAAQAEVVVLALPWQAAHDLLPSLDLADKVVVDCTNARGLAASGAETLHSLAPGAKFVKAFNSTGANNMERPEYAGGPLAMFYCGDHADAKKTVSELVRAAGFEPIDAGPLANARLLEAQAELWIWLASRGGLGREFGFRLVRR